MTPEEYKLLRESGLMWEIFPEFTGGYQADVLDKNKKEEDESTNHTRSPDQAKRSN